MVAPWGRVARLLFLVLLLGVLVGLPSGPAAARSLPPVLPHAGPPPTPPARAQAAALPFPGPFAPASSTPPTFEWGHAYIFYSPGDDATHFMGEGGAMVVDDHLHNITTFGGEGRGGLINYTVNYNDSTGAFQVAVPAPSPSARTNASFASVPGRDFAVLFGGLTDLRTQATTNDTWVYYFGNQTWQNVTHSRAPPARESAAFAVNASGNVALLEGGWAPDVAFGGSTGAVVWNDTWSLNLTTFDWTEATRVAAPPPMYGSVMIWQNATDRFDLFGGCALSCSGGLWSYGGDPAAWQPVATSGGPSARASPTFVWDAADGLGILYGGFTYGANGVTALQGGYLFDPEGDLWSPLVLGGGPGPRFDAPSAWADFPGCVGLNLIGGNTSLAGPPMNASVLEPTGAPSPNCFPYLISGGGPPPKPCSVAQSPLDLRVIDNFTGLGVPDATVEVMGGCVARSAMTNQLGYLNLSLPAPDNLSIAASAPGYRLNEVLRPFLPNTTVELLLPLAPYPSLRLRAWGVNASGDRVPLPGVTVDQGTAIVLGTTGPSGFLNVSHVISAGGNLTLYGARSDYSTGNSTVRVPYSGPFEVNLTLYLAGSLDVRALSSAAGNAPIPLAAGTLTDTDPGSGPPLSFTTNGLGWYNVTLLPAGNYTVSASAPGYFPSTVRFDHPWLATTTITVALAPQLGAILDVLVRSAATGDSLGGASVELLGNPTLTTNGAGYANYSNVRPAGLYQVVASASGYISNFSWVRLEYGEVLAPYLVYLRPIALCPGGPACPAEPTGASPPPFGYLGGGALTSALLVAAPAALLAAGLLYAALLLRGRDRPSRPTAAAPRPGGPAR